MGKIIRIRPPQNQRIHDSHVIPRFYLNKFADREKKVFVYRKGIPVKKKSTKSQCVERDYFEYDFGNLRSDNHYEHLFAKLETRAAAIYARILRAETLDEESVTTWAIFVATVFLRSTKVRSQMTPKTLETVKGSLLDPKAIATAQYDLFTKGRLYSKEEISAAFDRVHTQMQANPAFIQFTYVEQRANSLADAICRKEWHTLEPSPGKSFATSDCPVVTMKISPDGRTFAGYGFGQEDVAVLLPLTPQAMFVASPKGRQWTRTLDDVSTDTMNRAIVHHAHARVFSFRASEELKRLVDSEINQVIYGENAFVLPSNNNPQQ